MRTFIASIKIFFLIVYTLSLYLVYLAAFALIWLFKLPYEPLRNLYMYLWSKGMCVVLNIRVETEGEPPQAPFFLVSNHLSYIDIIPLYLNLKCTFVAKKEVRSWPLLGFMVKTMGVIFIDRSRKRDVTRVNEVLSNSLSRYQGIILFPEGTTSGGEDLLSFRPSLLDYPATEEIPVYYSTINYKTAEERGDAPANTSVCFYGARDPFHKHVLKLAKNRRIDCKIRFCSEPVQCSDRKELAQKLHSGMSRIFEPTS
jgi:1-acyl-sn-glycerol-3-phosphate acyltransferase